MTLIDRAILSIWPSVGVSRLQNKARAALLSAEVEKLSGYDAARRGPTDNFVPLVSGPNLLSMTEGRRAAAAAHDAARNDPLGRRAVSMLPAYIVGRGHRPLIPGAPKDEPHLAAWERFVETCDVHDETWDFHHFARMAVGAMVEAGFAFIEYEDRADVNAPLGVKVLEAAFLDQSVTRFGSQNADHIVINGIEIDARGKRIGYWLFDAHPNDNHMTLRPPVSRFVSVDRVDMVWTPRRPGELVPVTWLAAAIRTMKDRKDYLDFERLRAKVQACLALFVKGAGNGGAGQVQRSQSDQGTTASVRDAHGIPQEQINPATILYGDHGTEVTPIEPKGQGLVEVVLTTAERDVAASVSVPYFLLTGNYAGANFSTSRMALQAFRQELDVWQANASRLIYVRAWRRVMAAAARLGQVAGNVVPNRWIAPRLYVADENKDAQAKRERLETGLESHFDVIESEGRDPYAVLDDMQRWRDELQQRSLSLASAAPAAAAPAQPSTDANDEGSDEETPEGDEERAPDGNEAASQLSLNDLGIAVRSGVLTPEPSIEASIRAQWGLPEMGSAALAAWAEGGNIRAPITLAPSAVDNAQAPPSVMPDADEAEPEDIRPS
ncbi:MAG: phage portal protein [Pseudomonadota bacterium]